MYPDWQTRVWEAMHQNGNGCDYVSEKVIRDSIIEDGSLKYGERKYHSIFLTQVESMEPLTSKKLFDFVSTGGRVFVIEKFPSKAPGWKDHEQRDKEVQNWIGKMKAFPDHFIFLNKPEKDFTSWYKTIQLKYKIPYYLSIDAASPFISQIFYQAGDSKIIVMINSNMNASYELRLEPAPGISLDRQAWIWDPENGERYKCPPGDYFIKLDMGPGDLKLIVFDKEKKGPVYKPAKTGNTPVLKLNNPWSVTGQHIDGSTILKQMDELKDLKEIVDWIKFSGTIIYRNNFMLDDKSKFEWINLGKLFGVSELFINGINVGVKWYGRRIYHVKEFLKNGNNTIEVKIVTTLGNYLKSLTDNRAAQFWTNEGRTIQPIQSMGLLGPVTIY
jgi:hypothetical protein